MVNKNEIKSAQIGDRVRDTKPSSLEMALLDMCAMYAIDSGSKIEITDRKLLASRWSESIRHPFGHLFITEISLAMKWAGQGHLGNCEWPSIQAFNGYIRKYMELPERKAVISEGDTRLLDQKTKPSESEIREMMAKAWKLVCEAETNGILYNDMGNVLFDYMHGLEKIELDECDYEDALNYHKHFAELTEEQLGASGTAAIQRSMSKDAIRAYNSGDKKYIAPIAKKFALIRARKEQIMEQEAERIKSDRNK